MTRNLLKLIGLGVLLFASVFLSWWFLKGKTYEARCAYAYWKSNVDTNTVGEVIQPEGEWRLGAYVDYRRVAEESLSDFFAERNVDMLLFRDYLQSHEDSSHDVASVSNAFASIMFKIAGDPVAVVELSSKSESKDIALDVLRFTLLRYLAFIENNDRRREEKALAIFKNDIERKRCKGEDVSDIVARLEEAKVAVGKCRHRITIIKAPFIIQE